MRQQWVVILNGLVRQEKHWDRDRANLTYLKDDFNVVTVSAAVVFPGGEVVWEYPGEPGTAFLDLQYADFDEAYYNATDKVRLHFVTLAGLDRLLSRRESGLLGKSALPQRYRNLFGDLNRALEPGLLTELNQLHPPATAPR